MKGLKINCEDFEFYGSYKVYAILDENGTIVYIGCTKKMLRERMQMHSNVVRMKSKLYNYILRINEEGKELRVIKLYSFKSKLVASIVERILINFVKRFINPKILNHLCALPEDSIFEPYHGGLE